MILNYFYDIWMVLVTVNYKLLGEEDSKGGEGGVIV